MPAKIAIVGGGWYGCHIASSLLALGFQIKIFERGGRLLDQASGNNQFRLHLGFHYPRHSGTRMQSRDGFSRFLERYSNLSRPVSENVYAVPSKQSLIDFDTYKLIMTSTGIPYTPGEKCSVELRAIDGLLFVDERVVMIEKSRHHFMEQLKGVLELHCHVSEVISTDTFVEIAGERFDYMIDCTWGQLTPPKREVIYEPTLLLYFEGSPGLPALTFVDGPLYSIYPTEEPTIYTLSSVPYTPLGNSKSAAHARETLDRVDSALVLGKRDVMVAQAITNVPHFQDHYRFLGPQLSIKTKPVGTSADRSCYVDRQGRIFSVLSGKIDTIFFATEKILSQIEADHDLVPVNVQSRLREAIEGRLKSL